MKILQALALLIALSVCTTARALIPESGLWFTPGQGGRGLSIEMQDDNMFVTFYGYQPDGTKSAFYTSLGRYNAVTGVMTGYFAAAENGQCYGCAYRAPTLTDLGQARFQFTTRTTGQVTLPGNVVFPISRQVLRGNAWSDREELYGVWQIVDGSGVYFGESVWFSSPSTTVANGFNGSRWGTTRILVGGSTTAGSSWSTSVLIDSSASYYSFYAFNPTGNGWTGRSWTFLKSGSISGLGLESIGYKAFGREFAITASTLASAQSSMSALAAEVAAEARVLAAQEAAGTTSTDAVLIGDVSVSMADLAADVARLKLQLESEQ